MDSSRTSPNLLKISIVRSLFNGSLFFYLGCCPVFLSELRKKLNFQDIASKLVEERKHSEDLEQLRCELQANLDTERQTVQELQAKLQQLTAMHLSPIKNTTLFKQLDVIYQDDIKCKEEMLEENDHCESAISNGESEPEQNHINLRVSRRQRYLVFIYAIFDILTGQPR